MEAAPAAAAAELPAVSEVSEQAPVEVKVEAATEEAAAETPAVAENARETNAPTTRRSVRAASSAGDSADAPVNSHRTARAARGN